MFTIRIFLIWNDFVTRKQRVRTPQLTINLRNELLQGLLELSFPLQRSSLILAALVQLLLVLHYEFFRCLQVRLQPVALPLLTVIRTVLHTLLPVPPLRIRYRLGLFFIQEGFGFTLLFYSRSLSLK